jgi:SlyX protein
MSEERFIDLEIRLAHQDQGLHELNEVVLKQQQQIARLERLCASLAERLAGLSDAVGEDGGSDRPPPHY